MIRVIVTCLLPLLAAPVLAQDRLTPSQFLDLVEGRTATFDLFSDGAHVGVEEFLSRDRSVWARADGTCAYGRVTIKADQICFEYEDDL